MVKTFLLCVLCVLFTACSTAPIGDSSGSGGGSGIYTVTDTSESSTTSTSSRSSGSTSSTSTSTSTSTFTIITITTKTKTFGFKSYTTPEPDKQDLTPMYYILGIFFGLPISFGVVLSIFMMIKKIFIMCSDCCRARRDDCLQSRRRITSTFLTQQPSSENISSVIPINYGSNALNDNVLSMKPPVIIETSLNMFGKESEIYSLSKEECCICLDLLSNSSRGNPVTLQCNHNFHEICIQEWRSENNSCPLCRVEISIS